RWALGDLEVEAVASCADVRETCVPLWRESAEPVAERGRFVAWAASHAAVIAMANPEAAPGCALGLREAALSPRSTMALVLTADDLAVVEVPERRELKDAATRLGRAMAANDIQDTQHLDAFARASPSGRVAPWLERGPNTLVVVPRLSALVRLHELPNEI